MRIAHLAKQWCKDDLSVLKPISNFLLEKLTSDSPMDLKEVPFLDQTGQNYRVASVDVGATPCSMHIPLNQFLSMLLTCFNLRHEMADECLALILTFRKIVSAKIPTCSTYLVCTYILIRLSLKTSIISLMFFAPIVSSFYMSPCFL